MTARTVLPGGLQRTYDEGGAEGWRRTPFFPVVIFGHLFPIATVFWCRVRRGSTLFSWLRSLTVAVALIERAIQNRVVRYWRLTLLTWAEKDRAHERLGDRRRIVRVDRDGDGPRVVGLLSVNLLVVPPDVPAL